MSWMEIYNFLRAQSLGTLMLYTAAAMFLWLLLKFIFRSIFPKRVSRRYRKMQIHQVKKMYWEQFEKMVQELFRVYGYKVVRKGGRGADGGVDLLLHRGREISMVQCKRYKGNVGVKVIREMYAVGIDREYDKIYICTSSRFTKEAKLFARGKNIVLMDGEHILSEIRSRKSR